MSNALHSIPEPSKERYSRTPGSKKSMPRAQAIATIESMRQQQKQELMEVIEHEQRLEEERDKQLQGVTDEKERTRLEKIFGIERAKASERIV